MTTFNLEMSLFVNQFRGMAPPPQDKDYNELIRLLDQLTKKVREEIVRNVPTRNIVVLE